MLLFFVNQPVVHAANSDCWEKTGEAALQACSKIINSKHISGESHKKQILSRAYFHRGNAYYLKQNYNRAIVNYDTAINLNPNYLKAYHIRGNAYFLLGAYEKALADFNRVLDIDPNYKAVTYYRKLTQKKLQQMKRLKQKN